MKCVAISSRRPLTPCRIATGSGVIAVAPIGAFGAIAFTIGKYGIGSMANYGKLIIAVYGTCLIFIVFVLGAVAWWCRISMFAYLRYIREELLITFGTASTESVLPA